MLSRRERRYFDALVKHIKHTLNVYVDIVPANHKAIIPMSDDEQVLGCCHRMRDDDGTIVAYLITIDEPYVRACYAGRQTAYSPYSDNQLIETICHEIAHLSVWDHGKDHTALTNQFYNKVILSLQNSK